MQAVPCYSSVWAACTQEFVAPWRAVPANHIDFTTGIPERSGKVVEKIEEARIEMPDISGTVVPQKMVEPLEGVGDVLITATIDDIQPLPGVRVIKAQPIFVRHRR